jgi:hypothetical protein
VYGTQGDLEKKMFIKELKQLKQPAGTKWLLLGDLNLIYKAQDKSNGRLNRGMMLRFRKALDHLGVKEINLVGRKFTGATTKFLQPWLELIELFATLNGRVGMVTLYCRHAPLQPLTIALPSYLPWWPLE